MKNNLLMSAALLCSVLAVTACSTSPNPKDLPPGKYESQSSSTNSRSTTTSQKKETYVYTDGQGNKKATVKTDTETDPKGLLNKSTSTTTKSY